VIDAVKHRTVVENHACGKTAVKLPRYADVSRCLGVGPAVLAMPRALGDAAVAFSLEAFADSGD
jgi:hypothetical protein